MDTVTARHVLETLRAPWERPAVTVCLRSGRVAVLSALERRRRAARGWRGLVLADLAELLDLAAARPAGLDLEAWAERVAVDLTAAADLATSRAV